MNSLVQPSAALLSNMRVLLGAIIVHKVSGQIRSYLPLNIRDRLPSGRDQEEGHQKDRAFGPKATMVDKSPDSFRGKLTSSHSIEVIIPQTQA